MNAPKSPATAAAANAATKNVFLPLHPERVPLGLVLGGEQLRTGALRILRPIPRIDDERAAGRRHPAHDRHDPQTDFQAADAIFKPLLRDELRPQTPEARQPAAECQQVDRAEDHPVRDRPEFPEIHAHRRTPFRS